MAKLVDGRNDLPIFVYSEIDDLEITCDAFRVYAHLSRRAGTYGEAFPSYASIGEVCFKKDYPNSAITRRKHAIAAVKELVELRLVFVETRAVDKPNGKKLNQTNIYHLTPKSTWLNYRKQQKGVVPPQTYLDPPENQGGSTTEPKGTPSKVAPQEDLNIKHEHKQANSAQAESRVSAFSQDASHGKPITESEQELHTRPVNQTQTGKASSSSKKTKCSAAASLNANNQNTDNITAIRVPQKTEQKPIEFEVNDLGWLRMPRQKQYELARWLTTRRLCYQLLMQWDAYGFAKGDDGYIICEGNQITIRRDDIDRLENDLFNEDGSFPLQYLRDEVMNRNMLTQDEFNDILQTLFLDSVRWLKEQRANAKKTLDRRSPAFIFFDNDKKVVRQIKQSYRQQTA